MTRRIGLAQSSKPPIIEYDGITWRVWTAYNSDLSFGTAIVLDADGTATLETIEPDGTIKVARMH